MSRQVVMALRIWPFVLGALLVIGLNKVEHFFAPVVRDFVVTGMVKEPGAVTLSGYMRKVRDCSFLGVSAEASVGSDWADVPLKFLDTDNHTATRPTGTQVWGPWRVTVPVVPDVDAIRLTATHRCHPAWATETRLAIVPLRADP